MIADAEDTEIERPVTVKLVRPEWAESPEFRRRFQRLMKAMSSLSHPNIAVVHDWGEEQVGKRTTVYSVVEHLAGGSLRDLFDRSRFLEPSQALMVGLEACRGLDFAHRKGLVHTQLTPAKLVFGDDRRLRIVDFGLARLLGERDWVEPATVATHVARYASPEQALGQPIDGKSDVYSLALVMVEAVTGSVPFAARSTVATLSARVGRLMPVSADLGPLAAVLEKAGRPEPADRSTAAELGRGLVRAAEKLPRPGPLPLLVVSPHEDDPSQMRRPNDPTGGIARPAVDEDLVALVPTVAAAVVSEEVLEHVVTDIEVSDVTTTSGGPVEGADTTADHADASGDLATTDDTEDTPTDDLVDAPAGDTATPDQRSDRTGIAPPPPPPPPAPPAGGAPRLYDGDADRTTDELAALARPEVPGPPVVAAPPSDAPPIVTGPPIAVVAPADTTDVPPAGPPDTGGRRRRRWLPWAIAAVVVVALAGLGYLAYSLFQVEKHPVPELVGQDEAAARAQTAGFDWEIDVEHDRSDDHPVAGEIIRTAPAAGEQLAEGEPFLVVVSDGPELRTLPDLDGLARTDAETSLAQLRLAVAGVTEQHDETVPVGAVVSWSVPSDPSLGAGGEVLPDTGIALVVSSGPAPRTIPDVTGLPLAEATAQLTGIQLVATAAEPVFSDDVPTGDVVSVDPAVGTQVPRDSTVTLVPSKGVDLVVMPDLTGQNLEQIQATLSAAGLTVGSITGVSTGIYVEGSVLGADAGPGTRFKRGSAVDIVLL